MLTNNDTKLIKSLVKKKFRQKYNKFIVEGVKNIREVLQSEIKTEKIFATENIFENEFPEVNLISETELKKISHLVQPNTALAICEIPKKPKLDLNGILIALDDVRDPGNLGTIIRMADWFGVEQIICSNETVDLYNPKVIQAAMGSFTRVRLHYLDLEKELKNYRNPVLGAFMDGENIYNFEFPENAILMMGNEANGISENMEKFITRKITIPQSGKSQKTESLNVAMATGIILGEMASRKFS
jgi:TrmH family RNA methyltransferase